MKAKDIAELAKVLSAPRRVEILQLLRKHANKGGVKVEEIAILTRLSSPTVSHHLKALREADMVTFDKVKAARYYVPVGGSTHDLARAIWEMTGDWPGGSEDSAS